MANIDERYKRGKIYTIRCRYDDTLIYVGSTIDTLAKRMAGHRVRSLKTPNIILYKYVNNDWSKWYIELYEEFPCDNKNQLEKREGEVIRQIGNLNNNIAGRDIKQYRQDNRDKISEKKKQYRQDNHDKILEKKKQYHQDNRDEILVKKKEKCKCDVCGAEVVKNTIKRHQRTAKCMNYNLNNN